MVKYPPVTLGTAASTNTPGTYFCSVAAIMLLAVMGRVTRAQFLDAVEVPTTQATPLRLNLALPRTLRAIPLVLRAWTPTPSMVSPNTPAPFLVASPYTAEPTPAVWPHTPMPVDPELWPKTPVPLTVEPSTPKPVELSVVTPHTPTLVPPPVRPMPPQTLIPMSENGRTQPGRVVLYRRVVTSSELPVPAIIACPCVATAPASRRTLLATSPGRTREHIDRRETR